MLVTTPVGRWCAGYYSYVELSVVPYCRLFLKTDKKFMVLVSELILTHLLPSIEVSDWFKLAATTPRGRESEARVASPWRVRGEGMVSARAAPATAAAAAMSTQSEAAVAALGVGITPTTLMDVLMATTTTTTTTTDIGVGTLERGTPSASEISCAAGESS